MKGSGMNTQADGISNLRQVRATFATADRMQDAVSKLSISGFDRAEIRRQDFRLLPDLP
jgi:hypothetical protein